MATALLATVGLALVVPTSSAAQHWSPIGLSRDGTHWSQTLDRPLFRDGLQWSPGLTRQRTFYVRNESHVRARLIVSIHVIDRTGLLAGDAFRLGISRHRDVFHRIRSKAGRPMRSILVKGGEAVPLTVRARLLPWARNRTMDQHLTFTVRVRLTQLIRGVHP